MSTWQYNAGLVGLVNILDHSGESVDIHEQYIEVKKEQLENFAEKYFKYMIDTYNKNISWHRIVSYEDKMRFYKNADYENFTEKSLEDMNKYIKDVLKKYVKSNSYKAAYQLVDGDMDIMKLEKEITPVKLKRNEAISDRIDDVKLQMGHIQELIDFMKREEVKRYVAGKNVIYTFIKNAWNGVCFLNPQTKEKDFYTDYESYFVEPLHEYIEDDKAKYKYNCFSCDLKIKDLKNDFSFLNETGFDVNRKSSHVWNFINDIAICNICKLVYSCIPAGFAYAYGQGIFVNNNTSVTYLMKTNNSIKNEILGKDGSDRRALTCRALIHALNSQWEKSAKYEFADIQVVRYEMERYKFNMLSKDTLKVVDASKELLGKLSNASYKEDSEYVSVYESVVDRLLNNQNLFTLIHKAVLYRITSPNDTYYNTAQLAALMKINVNFMKGMGYMEKIKDTMVDDARKQGYWLKEGYAAKGSKEKMNGISYRLLNALKTSNENMFMDTVLNCYLYVKKPVPQILMNCLRDEDAFKTVGYAFVAGLNPNPQKSDEEKNKGE